MTAEAKRERKRLWSKAYRQRPDIKERDQVARKNRTRNRENERQYAKERRLRIKADPTALEEFLAKKRSLDKAYRERMLTDPAWAAREAERHRVKNLKRYHEVVAAGGAPLEALRISTRERCRAWWGSEENRSRQLAKQRDERIAVRDMAASDQVFRENARRKQRVSLLKRYGMSVEDYERMLDRQDGKCAICRLSETVMISSSKAWAHDRAKLLSVDHDHATGVVRELLCVRCNTMIGAAKDDPERLIAAAAYLRRHGK